ncbi:hypothetical protein [Xenorhabdus poinarii]|uniref:hypothetical protein n=1 Tax=Xenorhabdus poinarii TaxID=40577 RepID=UPI000A7E783B|nr:hypothetical protein [Xenorhabdus poinarii]
MKSIRSWAEQAEKWPGISFLDGADDGSNDPRVDICWLSCNLPRIGYNKRNFYQ